MIEDKEQEKMISPIFCDEDIIKSVPNYESYSIHPNIYGAWMQGAQWERNRVKKLNNKDNHVENT